MDISILSIILSLIAILLTILNATIFFIGDVSIKFERGHKTHRDISTPDLDKAKIKGLEDRELHKMKFYREMEEFKYRQRKEPDVND